jgi:serine/threonine-protein kinase
MSPPLPPSADRNLLVGVLALQRDLVTPDALVGAVRAWVRDKGKPLGAILYEQGHLTADHLRLLDDLVANHLQAHGGDSQKGLSTLSPLPPAVWQEFEAVADPDVRACLARCGSTARGAGRTNDWPADVIPPIPPPAPRVRYRVLRPHAKGGLGEVFVAEDAELGRRVALKEIRAERAGEPASRQRFLLEAEITGGLEHPGVVPVYGLGAHADGRPFYAMRLIHGETLQEAIRRFHTGEAAAPGERGLALRELLGRFVGVCNAVAYAHSRGVLHRDLKPANVMLGPYGETLVVDWGLAKPVGRPEAEADGEASLRPRTAAEPSVTSPGHALGTPAYMSPEQAAGRLAELGPATDVYSLGATLYELLTGRAPFTGDVGKVLDAVKQGTFPPPRAVRPDVPRALEAVCLKAMALRPEDRYASALEVAEEVGRWMAGEPVRAYPEPWPDRARRWARRHRTVVAGVAAAAAVGAAILAVAAVLLSAAHRAEQSARREAEGERDVAREQKRRTREALDLMTSQVTTDWLATQKELLPQQRQFLERALGYYQEFAREAATDEAGREAVADAHYRVGRMLHRLGQHDRAEPACRHAVELRERLAADSPAEPRHRSGLASGLINWGVVLQQLGRKAEAEAAYHRAADLFEALAGAHRDVPDYRYELANCLINLGLLRHELDQHETAEAAYRRAVALGEELTAGHPTVPEYRNGLATALVNLGSLALDLDRGAEAEAAYRRAAEHLQRLTDDHPAVTDYPSRLAGALTNLGVLLRQPERAAEAESAYRRATELRQALVARAPAVPQYRSELAGSLLNWGVVLQRSGDAAGAEAATRRATDLLEKLAADHKDVPEYRSRLATALNNLALMLLAQDRGADAEAACRKAVGHLDRLVADHPGIAHFAVDLGASYATLGTLLRERGEPRAALEWYAKAIARLQPVVTAEPRLAPAREALRYCHCARAETLSRLADHAAAVADWDRAIELDDGRNRDDLRLQRAACLVRAGEVARAAAAAEELAAAGGATADMLYNCACVLALAAARDTPAADRHAPRAVALLRQAVVKGYEDMAHLLKDPDLGALRNRSDFADLLWDLADSPLTPNRPAAGRDGHEKGMP